ncbi:hypothetical protein [Ascidiaceihabitans sp.]|uniref:hypothetical protein n=1 Tax=Ascidiaceihabitans sp. TaxID=1872644 RepID=UPI003299BC12
MICFCGWILVHGDFLVLIFLILPAALISMALALPTLAFEGNKGLIAGGVITVVANLAIVFAEDLDSAGRSMVPAMTSMRDYFIVLTHYVASSSAAVEWWPRDSNGRTSERLSRGMCLKVVELYADGKTVTDYSRVAVPALDGTRYILRSDLIRLRGVQRCDENNRFVSQ